MKAKDALWSLKMSSEFLQRLRTTSDVLDVPSSQFVREAVAEKIEKLSKKNPRLAEALNELRA